MIKQKSFSLKLSFDKYQGTGNDFIMVNAFDFEDLIAHLTTEIVKKLCDRHFGVGADGLIILKRHPDFDFEMIYFNSDGRESTMCGNGGRCIVRYAHNLGYIGEKARFMAIDGEHEAVVGEHISLKMIDVPDYEKIGEDYFINTGSPHYIKLTEDLNHSDFIAEAKKVRYNERFEAEGVNVNFIRPTEDELQIRTYERGVEDETLSCGTGVVAAALAAKISQNRSRNEIRVEAVGGNLHVEFDYSPEKGFTNIFLTGPAEKIFEGVIEI